MTRELNHLATLAALARRQARYLRLDGLPAQDHRVRELVHLERRARAVARKVRKADRNSSA